MSKKNTLLLLVFTMLTKSVPSFAEEADFPGPSHTQDSSLSTMTVEGDRGSYFSPTSTLGTKTSTPLIEVPQSISVINRQQMDDQGVRTLSDALSYSAGIDPDFYGYDSRINWFNVRGFDADIFIDGLRFVKTLDILGSFSTPMYAFQQVQILRGPGSALYGSSSVGGILDIETKHPTPTPFVEIQTKIGDDNRFEADVDVGGKLDADGHWYYRLTGIASSQEFQLDFARERNFYLAPTVTWQPTQNTKLTILTSYYRQEAVPALGAFPLIGTLLKNPYGQIPTSFYTSDPDDHQNKEQYDIGYEFTQPLGDDWILEQKFHYQYVNSTQTTTYGVGLQPDLQTLNRNYTISDGTTNSLRADIHLIGNFDTGFLSHQLLVGLDYQYQKLNDNIGFGPSYSINIYHPTYGQPRRHPYNYRQITEEQQLGIYLQDQIKFTENWILTLSGRHDWVSEKNSTHTYATNTITHTNSYPDAWTGRVGLTYKSDIGLAPYVSAATSFIPQSGTAFEGTPFSPLTGKQFEAGIKYQPPQSQNYLAVSVYHLTENHYTVTDLAHPLFMTDAGEVRSRGIELEGVWNLSKSFNLRASYTYQDVNIIKSTVPSQVGLWPATVPQQLASIWGKYTIQSGPFSGVGFGCGVRYLGVTRDTSNQYEIPANTLVDAGIYYHWEHWDLALNIRNLFDKIYVAGAYGYTNANYGTRRTIEGTIRYRF
jgi:iron complex outermembrane recepter protein